METNIELKRTRVPLYLQTLIGMVIGAILGKMFGTQVAPLGKLAGFLIELVKFAAVPLLFLAILDALVKAEFRGKSLLLMFGISMINATGAITIALLIMNVFHPGDSLKLAAAGLTSSGPKLPAVGSDGITKLILTSPMIGAIVLSLFLGGLFILCERGGLNRKYHSLFDKTRTWVDTALRFWMKAVSLVLYLVPWAVFGAVAKVVGEHGFSMLRGLAVYLVVCIGGMVLHVLLVYHTWILGVAKMSFRKFWREAKEPVIHGFGINSSLATLPVTLSTLKRLGVSDSSARLSACIGTNFNNDGILLYEVVAVLFLSQAYGHDLDLVHQLLTAFICVIATIGVGGIPEAGIISLTLVLGTVHMPAEAITILLTVDWVVGRCRSATNVLGDISVAIGLDALTKRKTA